MEVFAAQLSEADHEFGRILESLRRTGELDNTLVNVTSDNGASAEGGLGGLYSMMRGANGEPPTFEIGRASCRESVGQYVSISVDAVSLNNKKKKHKQTT